MVNPNNFGKQFRQWGAVIALCLLGSLTFARSTGDSTLSHTSACILREDSKPGTLGPLNVTALASVPNYLSEMRGQQWNKEVVTLHLIQSDPKRKAGETERSLQEATRLWNEEIGGVVRVQWTTAEDADVTVRFAPGSELPYRAVGRTDAQFRLASRTLIHAEVTLSEGMSDARLVQVAAHEIGHALGIPGHSPHTEDLMYPITHTPARITERDRNTMCLNYQALPVRSSVAGSTDTIQVK